MKFCSRILLRPICFIILLGLASFMITKLWLVNKRIEHTVVLRSHEIRKKLFSEIENTAALLLPLNSSAANLARSLSSSLNGTELSFANIQAKVAPTLFLALSTIPQLSQVFYIGADGLLFSYYNDDHQTLAVFCNTSYSSNWYSQPVNRDTGMLYGEAISTNSMLNVNASWFQEALNSTTGYSSLGVLWNNAQNPQFLDTVPMDGRGLITLGFPMKVVTDHFAGINFHGGDFHLASWDGEVLIQTKLPNTQILVDNGTISVQLVEPNGDLKVRANNISCESNDGEVRYSKLNIWGTEYKFYCSNLEIAGVQSVYVLAYPAKGFLSIVHKNSQIALTLLVLLFVFLVITLSIFIVLIVKAARREIYLCAALIKQMEATQQAERKSMNKSLAFASASHDVRASLAAITGLIELSQENVTSDSELAANLVQMNTCTKDLLGILNSVLDTSKIEAGKMQLEEGEFNMFQLLEDVVDMYHPVGAKKGIDVVLDPCDGSVLKSYLVHGDRGKLKQILCNLLSNAVKFTSEGHVTVRAVVRKISFENAIISSNRKVVLKCFSWMCYKNKEGFNELDALRTVQQNPNYMEFVFEVDDTGKGIPKDKQKSVFEDFVQVKETAPGQEGTGLGLGIVQSLVRLMGGEIGIIEKELGERGTCFRFNIFLTTIPSRDIEEEGNLFSGLHLRGGPISRSDGSHVVLLIAGDERRRVAKRLIENLGLKVTVIKRGKDLPHVLERIKHKLEISHFSDSSCKTEVASMELLSKSASPNNSIVRVNDGTLSTKDGNDCVLPYHRKSSSKGSLNFVLIVIDAAAGSSSELCLAMANFRRDVQDSRCKIVWLDNPFARNAQSEVQQENMLASLCDHILSKPLQGSRLYQVLRLLPEFGGTFQCNPPKTQEVQSSTTPSHSNELKCIKVETSLSHKNSRTLQHIEIRDKPLNGRKVLLVEDGELLRKLATASIRKLGADVEVCENGKEALDRVCKLLNGQRMEGHCNALPYDYIFMDCEMPIMNGYEATRLIRVEEKYYGIHIPIIALTAHTMPEEARKIVEAGMDFHLTKPLQVDKLLDVIHSIK